MAINYEPSGRGVCHSGGAPLRASWPHHMDSRLDFPAGFHPAYGRKHCLLHTCESGDVRCSQPRASGQQAMGQDSDLLAIRGDTRHPAGCRVGRWPIPLVIDVVLGCGIGIFVQLAGWIGVAWAETVNRFFEPGVRIQTERGHHVIDAGPYALIRHPGYFAAVLLFVGIALSLGSWWAL